MFRKNFTEKWLK